jgi:hypothetical protein
MVLSAFGAWPPHDGQTGVGLPIRLGLKAEDLGKLLSAYPSASSNIANMLL